MLWLAEGPSLLPNLPRRRARPREALSWGRARAASTLPWRPLVGGRCDVRLRMGTLRVPVVIGGYRRGRHSPTRVLTVKLIQV
jgi:hypothetical protein